MSRPARILSETGMYHIIFRGINRQNLFEDDNDFMKMEEIITEVKAEKGFELYAYCFMTNHVHLFIRELHSGDIVKIMHKILTKYVGWFNFKYERSGSLIGNRYKSEPIEDNTYYLQLVRYIHQNPLKAGMVEKLEDYRWSSYGDYIVQGSQLTDVDFMLSMLDENKSVAIKLFKEFHSDLSYEDFTITDGKKLTDEQLKRKAQMLLDNVELTEIYLQTKPERDKLLNLLRQNGFTIGQLERLTGISRGIITRAKQETRGRFSCVGNFTDKRDVILKNPNNLLKIIRNYIKLIIAWRTEKFSKLFFYFMEMLNTTKTIPN